MTDSTVLPEIDINQIATDLNGKADKDLTNAEPSQTFKTSVIHLMMPDYTAGITVSSTIGTVYTAPKDGYFIISCSSSNLYVYCYVQVLDSSNNIVVSDFGNMVRYQQYSGSLASTSIPLPKGYKIKIIDIAGASLCKFYPMKGA